MTRAVYFLFAAWEDDAASKLQNERLVKNVISKIWQRLLVHVIFKVSIINIWIHIISFVECGHRTSKHVDMLTVTIVIRGITVNLVYNINAIAVVSENCNDKILH